MITISKFKPEELSELQELIYTTIRKCYPEVYLPTIIDFFIKHHSTQNIIKRSREALIFILRDKNKIRATGFLSGEELGGVYVHPDFQGKGYGRKIVDFILQQAKNKGIKKVHLDSTPIARGMYEKLGFEVIEPAIQMIDNLPLHYFKMQINIK